MNKKVSSTSSKKNSFSKVIKIVLKLFLIVCTILTSTLLLLLSLNDPISLILNNNYKVSKAKITDSKLIIKDDKYEEYEFLKFEISYHFTTNDNKTVKSNDVIVSPLYYIVHKFKKDTIVLYNVKDSSKNHIFQIYMLHFIVSIILFYVSIIEFKKTLNYKGEENI